jgi:hypothetical protein
VPVTALVPAHEGGRLVSVGVLTGASDDHFGCYSPILCIT